MAENINILLIATHDINGVELKPSILDACIDQVQPLNLLYSPTPGLDTSLFYVSAYELITKNNKKYYKIQVYQLDSNSTDIVTANSAIDDFSGFEARGTINAGLVVYPQNMLFPLVLAEEVPTGIRSVDEWSTKAKHTDITWPGYCFGRTPNVSLQWEMEITASATGGSFDLVFGMMSTGSYWADLNQPGMTAGIPSTPATGRDLFPISQSLDDVYDPATQSGGSMAKRWGYNSPAPFASLHVNGIDKKIKISGSVRADTMVSESMFFPYMFPRQNASLENFSVTLSLNYDDSANNFTSLGAVTTIPSSSQTLQLLISVAPELGDGGSQVFQYSDYDVLINNALIGTPNKFIQEVDYNNQPGGTVTTQLAPSTVVGPVAFNQDNGFPITNIGEGELFYGYDVGIIEGVEAGPMFYGNPGTGGLFDITIENTSTPTGFPAPEAFFQRVTKVTVNPNVGNSKDYIQLDEFRFTQFYLNQQSTFQGSGNIGTNSPAQLQRFNLFSFGPTTPVNIQQIIANSAQRADVPESNYTSLASILPRYNGSELKSVDYNFFTAMPSQSQGGIGKRYPKGLKSPFLRQKLLPLNKVEFLDGNTGSWNGDISYGNTACIDKRPTYFAHFDSSIADPTFYDTTTFAIDSLIFVPSTPIQNQKSPVAEVINIDGSNENLQIISSTFEPNRKAAIIYNNPQRSYEELIYGEEAMVHPNNANNYIEGTNNSGSLSFTSFTTGSYKIEAPATEFQFIAGNEYSRLGTNESHSFRIPQWLNLNSVASVADDQMLLSGDNLVMRGSMYKLHTTSWGGNSPLKFNYNDCVVPMFVTASLRYDSTAIVGTNIAFNKANYNFGGNTAGYNGGVAMSINVGNFPNPSWTGQNSLFLTSVDGSPGRGVSGSLTISTINGIITEVNIKSFSNQSNGWAYGDVLTIPSQFLNGIAFPLPGGGAGSGTGDITCSFNDTNYFSQNALGEIGSGTSELRSTEGEDLGMLIMKGPVTYLQNLLPRFDPSTTTFYSLQAPFWGMMNTYNHATTTGSIASGSQQNTGSVPNTYSDNGYARIYMDDGDGLWSLGNIPYPCVSSTPRQYQSTETSVHKNGWFGGVPKNAFNHFGDIGEKGRANSLNYWQQNLSQSQLWNFEDQSNAFMVEEGDEIRATYKVEEVLEEGLNWTIDPKRVTTYTQDFTVVDYWQPAPTLITDWYSESDVPGPTAKPQMQLTCSGLPLEGIYSPEEVVRRMTRQANEFAAGNNGGSVFIKGDQYGASFTNQTSAGFGSIVNSRVLHSMANGDISGSVVVTLNIEEFPPSSSQVGMTNKHTYLIGTNQGWLDVGVEQRSGSQAGGFIGSILSEGNYSENKDYPLSGSIPILDYESSGNPKFSAQPDPAFAFDRLIVHPDPRKLEFKIPSGSIRSVTIRKRDEVDNRIVLNVNQPNGELGSQTPTGDGYLIPNDLSSIQQENIKTLIKELKGKRLYTKDSDNNVKN